MTDNPTDSAGRPQQTGNGGARPGPCTNWCGTDSALPAVDVAPATREDLVRIVRDTARHPSPVRAVGHLHSTNACFATHVLGSSEPRGTLLRMMQPAFSRVEIETVDGEVYVRAGAGAQLIEIRNMLRPLDRELPVSPEIGNATAGSIACGGTKDATVPWTEEDRAQISAAVVEIRYVDAHGNSVRVDANGATLIDGSGPAPLLPDLRAVRSSYGLFGIVYEVRLRTVERAPVRTEYEWVPLPARIDSTAEQIPDIAAVFGGADGVLGFFQPYHGGILVERRTRLPRGTRITTDDRVRRALRDWIWEWGASEAVKAADAVAMSATDPREAVEYATECALDLVVAGSADNPLKREFLGDDAGTADEAVAVLRRALEPAARLPRRVTKLKQEVRRRVFPAGGPRFLNPMLELLDHAPQGVFDVIQRFTGHRSDSMLDFTQPPDRRTTFDFTFWVFPERRWRETMAGYLAFCRQWKERTGFRPALLTQIYFMGRDRSSLLAPCPGERRFTLDVAHAPDIEGDKWRAFNEAYNGWAADHDGRPLLNQTKYLESTPDARRLMDRAFGADWASFSAMVWQANPAVPDAADGRFVSDFFRRLLHPR